jgi:hypothetical protein
MITEAETNLFLDGWLIQSINSAWNPNIDQVVEIYNPKVDRTITCTVADLEVKVGPDYLAVNVFLEKE